MVEGRDPENKTDDRNIGYLKKFPVFKIDTNKTCVQLLLVEKQFVVLVYEYSVTVCNA